MKNLIALSFLVLLTAAGEGRGERHAVGEIVEGFQLILEFQTNQFSAGEPVRATVVLRNTTDETRDLAGGTDSSDDFEWIVVGPRRERLKKLPFSHQSMSSKPLQVGAQGEHTVHVDLSRIFDLSIPGEYVVTATRAVPMKGSEKFFADPVAPGFKWLAGYVPITVRSENCIFRIQSAMAGENVNKTTAGTSFPPLNSQTGSSVTTSPREHSAIPTKTPFASGQVPNRKPEDEPTVSGTTDGLARGSTPSVNVASVVQSDNPGKQKNMWTIYGLLAALASLIGGVLLRARFRER
jgi:hypothetical protein